MTNLATLNTHLFAQLHRLSDETMDDKDLENEVKRAEAITGLAEQVVSGVKLQLEGAKLVAMHGDRMAKMVPLLTNETKQEPEPNGEGQGPEVQS